MKKRQKETSESESTNIRGRHMVFRSSFCSRNYLCVYVWVKISVSRASPHLLWNDEDINRHTKISPSGFIYYRLLLLMLYSCSLCRPFLPLYSMLRYTTDRKILEATTRVHGSVCNSTREVERDSINHQLMKWSSQLIATAKWRNYRIFFDFMPLHFILRMNLLTQTTKHILFNFLSRSHLSSRHRDDCCHNRQPFFSHDRQCWNT